nr:pre mRNA splicing factor CWC22 [Hymenolepis microstoma]
MSSPGQSVDLFGKTGGAYIPPARLRQMQTKITDKSTDAYQRIAWEALKKSIQGLINRVNVSNVSQVVRQLLMENIVRGRGLLVKSLITSQMTSTAFTHIFAALIAIINTKFPQIGELLLKRLINEFQKAFRRNQKDRCLSTGKFLAHLVNQKVAHELIVLQLLKLLLKKTTNDSVEVSVALLKECGAFLSRVNPDGLADIFDHLRRVLNKSQCDKRISYMIEVLFQIRRDKWRDYPIVIPELDLIKEDDQITHTLSPLDQVETEDSLNIYRFDSEYEANEARYIEILETLLGDDIPDEAGSSGSESGSGDSDDEEGDVLQGPGEQDKDSIVNQTDTNIVHLRRKIYLVLQSSISADEGAHRLLQLKLKPREEYEVASMVLDCCAQTRIYETRYGILAQHLCHVLLSSGKKREDKQQTDQPSEPPRPYVAQFERIFGEQYATIHRLETAKLTNVAMFFAHLLSTDSVSWSVLECVKLNERDTSSSSRIFLKFLFQELCSLMGLANLQARLRDKTLQPFFVYLLPRNNPKDTRFAINFLNTIGLGELAVDLRAHLQATKAAAGEEAKLAGDVENSTSSTSSSGSCSNSSASESESSASEKEPPQKKRK